MNTEQYQQLLDRLEAAENTINSLQANQIDPNHYHNGFDSNNVNFSDVNGVTFVLRHSIYGTDAATATNYGVFFIAPFACYVSSVTEQHFTAGTAGGTVSLNIEKLTGTQAPNSGVTVLSSDFSLKATANTVQNGALSLTKVNTNLAIGNRLCMKDTGTLTSVSDVCVTLVLTVI